MGFEPDMERSRNEVANEFVERMESTLGEAKAAPWKSKEEMTQYYNRRRDPAPTFEPGDRVFLDPNHPTI